MNCRRFFLTTFILMLIITPAALAAATRIKPLEIGEQAPDFDLPGVDGRNYKLADFADAKILVIVFTANHCPTAQAYEDRIMKLAADYKDKGVAVVAISPNNPLAIRLDELGYSDLGDTFEEMKTRARERQFNFPYLYDGETQKVSLAYGPVSTPHVFIFDKERKLQYAGAIDNSEDPSKVKKHFVRDALDALLEGRDVTIKKVKTFGCSIKWSDKRRAVEQAFKQWAKEPVDLNSIDADGVRKLMKNDSGKLRLVNIWATWCGPCVYEMPELVSINRIYRGRAFEMITISGDMPDKKEQVLAFLKDKQASCKNYLISSEDKTEVLEAVDAEWQGGIPYTVLVKPGGEIIFRHTGVIDPLEVKKVIVEQLGRYYF